MGAMVSYLAVNAACCCTSAACHCCSKALTPTSSTATRAAYAVMLMLVSIFAWTTETGWIENLVNKLPAYANMACPPGLCSGPVVVLRIMFALVLFHTTLAALLVGVKSSRDKRAGIQNGYWGPKLIIWLVLTVLAFLIPVNFFHAYGIMSFIGAIAFIIIQLVLLIDFAATWNESWVGSFEESGDKKWVFLLIGTVSLFYVGTLVATILLYVYFCRGGGCGLNIFFVTFNLILSIAVSLLSISPRVQEVKPTSGLLQASIVVMYNTYVLASSMSDEVNVPGEFECNTIAHSGTQTVAVVVGTIFTFVSIAYSTSRAAVRGKLLNTGDQPAAAPAASSVNDLALILDAPTAAIPMTTAPAAAAGATDAAPADGAALASVPAAAGTDAKSAEAPPAPPMMTASTAATDAGSAATPKPARYDEEAGLVPASTKESRRRILEEIVEDGALPKSALAEFDEEGDTQSLLRVRDDEEEETAYYYSVFHIIFALAAMYMSMLMTGWNTADPSTGELKSVGHDWTTVWVRIASTWAAYALFIWTLVAPIVLPGREWH